MPTIDLVDLQKKKVGTVDLSPVVFGCEPRATLVHEAVIMQRACERRGTASTLRRGEVSGSGKSPGSKSIQVVLEPARFVLQSGVMEGVYLDRSQEVTPIQCPRKSIGLLSRVRYRLR